MDRQAEVVRLSFPRKFQEAVLAAKIHAHAIGATLDGAEKDAKTLSSRIAVAITLGESRARALMCVAEIDLAITTLLLPLAPKFKVRKPVAARASKP